MLLVLALSDRVGTGVPVTSPIKPARPAPQAPVRHRIEPPLGSLRLVSSAQPAHEVCAFQLRRATKGYLNILSAHIFVVFQGGGGGTISTERGDGAL